MTASILDFFW